MCLFSIYKLTQPTLCLLDPIAQCSVQFNSLVCVPETDTHAHAHAKARTPTTTTTLTLSLTLTLTLTFTFAFVGYG